MRRFITLLIFILLTIGSINAQDDTWLIWVYEANLGQAIQVDNSGVVQRDVTLTVPTNYAEWAFSPQLAVSPDGTRLAYVVTGKNAADETITSFVVYEASSARVLFTYDAPIAPRANSLDYNPVAFSSTGNAVVFAYATGQTNEESAWRIVVFNSIDGRVISELTNNSPTILAQSVVIPSFSLPVIQYFGEASLSFSMLPYQTPESEEELFSFEWDIVIGRVVRSNRAPYITGETWLATGETLVPILDERINFDSERGAYTNAVHVYRPDIQARVPFFATMTYDIDSANFVQNGERIVLLTQDLLSSEPTRLLIERSGISRVLPNIAAVNNKIISTPDGFAYVIENPQTPFLVLVNTRDEAFPQVAIWQAPSETHFVPVWASVTDNADYQAWAQLAAPVLDTPSIILPNISSSTGVDPQAVASPTPLGSFDGILTVDSVALINTTDGDRLNMRDRPGLSSNVIARVEHGVRVVIISGPIAMDGFTWWEVRLPTNQIGWVVERAEGVQTLVSAG